IMLLVSMLVFTAAPVYLISLTGDPFVGLSLSVLVWVPYFVILSLWRRFHSAQATTPSVRFMALSSEQQANLMNRGIAGGFWFGTIFAAISLVIDLLFFFTNSYGTVGNLILVWVVLRTVLLPIAGYFLGRLGGAVALSHALKLNGKNGNGRTSQKRKDAGFISSILGKRQSNATLLTGLSNERAREEARDLVPNDAPLRSRGATNFYLLVLFALLLLYPLIDPFLFGDGTLGRLASYGDAGRYVILAFGLNIVVGFAGLLDLGYVAFFVFGAYTWAIIGSPQLTVLTGIAFSPAVWPWLFWPTLLVAALIAALWGVLLGAPTLRLRGDYLAIVTLGFGEIIPIIAQNMDKYTG
ncbi:MAG: ABC transporter permease subunit, partial [Ktedonobacteraceae bacterium]